MDFRKAVIGGRSVGVPGVLRALELAHQAHGRLDWGQDFQPAIAAAAAGFAVSPRLHELLSQDRVLPPDPMARALFYQPNGQALPVGALLRKRTNESRVGHAVGRRLRTRWSPHT